MNFVITLETIVVALVSSTGGITLLQFILNRKGRKAEVARHEAETEQIRQQTEKIRKEGEEVQGEIKASAQVVMQEAALKAADLRYEGLHEDYEKNRTDLREIRKALVPLLRIVGIIINRMPPTDDGKGYLVTVTAAEHIALMRAFDEANDHML